MLAGEISLADVLGFDIGGVNTKAALLRTQKGKLQKQSWQSSISLFGKTRKNSQSPINAQTELGVDRLDGLGVTMTAELSDAYKTKREGVHQILACVKKAFPNTTYSCFEQQCTVGVD